jgi:hypothetical protein
LLTYIIDKEGLSEYKHGNNMEINANSENAKSRMEASSVGKLGYRDKQR